MSAPRKGEVWELPLPSFGDVGKRLAEIATGVPQTVGLALVEGFGAGTVAIRWLGGFLEGKPARVPRDVFSAPRSRRHHDQAFRGREGERGH